MCDPHGGAKLFESTRRKSRLRGISPSAQVRGLRSVVFSLEAQDLRRGAPFGLDSDIQPIVRLIPITRPRAHLRGNVGDQAVAVGRHLLHHNDVTLAAGLLSLTWERPG